MIRRLLLLNGLAAIGVVVNHATGWGYTAMFWWAHRYRPVTSPNFDQMGGLSYYGLRSMEQLIMFSIPAFLFVSGFFIAFATKKNQSTVEWHVVGSRIKNLVIPYVIWSTIILLGQVLQGDGVTAVEYIQTLLFGRAALPYYYVPLLIQFYLLSPILFVPAAKKNWKLLLLLTGLIQLTVLLARYPELLGLQIPAADAIGRMTPGWFFPGTIFWFALGVVAGFQIRPFKAWLDKYKWGLLGLTILFFFLAMADWEIMLQRSGEWLTPTRTLLDEFYSGFFILAFMAFQTAKVPYAKQVNDIGVHSYGIYLVHAPVLEYLSRAIYFIAPVILGYQIIFQPILIIAGIGIPMLMMNLMNRSPARKEYKYLFG
ncbi:MAG TPA: acyltransferase [Chloroflexi bacterium]|nr:acyltransferase [Chloroflexota bacterium]